jgi:predicted alpha-1,6-mannanase (GH76 family)
MYPSNVRERLFMYNYVWPRMIVEVRADNRVRKFRKTADGKQLEHWDLNTNSKRGWQLRKTPNKSPTKTVEPVGKRDP